jgi:Fe2+ or Zn2+ uptake regulation protein
MIALFEREHKHPAEPYFKTLTLTLSRSLRALCCHLFGTCQFIDLVQNIIYSRGMVVDGEKLLRERGLHVTAQRLAVLQAAVSRPHCTADEVTDKVCREIGTVSKQAVYDSLTLLTQQGILRRMEPAGSPARYEQRVGDNHHHLICRACGRTADAHCRSRKAPCLAPIDTFGFEIDEAEIIFWGTCSDCLKVRRAGSTRKKS